MAQRDRAMPRRWTDPSQPQTLQAAVLLSYFNAVLGLLFAIVYGLGFTLLVLIVGGVAAIGIANERRWAYRLAVVAAGLYVLVQLAYFVTGSSLSGLLNLLFAVVLLALLLHPTSRHHQRIHFR